MMVVNVPPDLEALMQKRLASGAFATPEDVLRRALEALDAEESWDDEERQALDAKIDRVLEQAAAGKTYGPEQARQKLAAMRESHLADRP